MFTTRLGRSDKWVFYTLAVLSVTAAALFFTGKFGIVKAQTVKADAAQSPAATFTNPAAISWGTGGANSGSVYPSSIVASGLPTTLPSTPGSVKVTINNFSHSFASDLGFVLVGPTGAALLIQDAAGGEDPVSGVTYTLSDTGAAVLPEAAWTAGTYKPTCYFLGDSFPAPGPLTAYGNPGPASGGAATFASVFGGTNPNGTWNLYTRDFVSGDGGSIAGGWTLEITAGPSITPQHVVDYDGNGKTDFSVVRNTGGGSSGQVTFFVGYNGPGTGQAWAWGIASDSFKVQGDYDGDGKTDVAVWRPGAPTVATFYILQSQTNTLRQEAFGQTGDDPSVVGDYNGDGKADLAVYRGGANSGDQSTWFFRSAPNGPVTYMPWGQNGDFPAPGDYDGDGKSDFVVQRNNGGGQARFWMNQTAAGMSSVVFGTPTDVIVPGDYDGDGKTDIATIRGSGGQILWFVRPSSTGVISGNPYAVFGASATDFPTQGDYDGDGKTDVAIWRPSATPGASLFWALGSTSGAFGAPFGANGDYPLANYNSH